MKKFTTIKVGYTSGIYGCTAEYFTTIIINGEDVNSINHYGMYGSNNRINKLLKDAGFEEFYILSSYGKMTKKDICDNFVSENEAVKIVNNWSKCKK